MECGMEHGMQCGIYLLHLQEGNYVTMPTLETHPVLICTFTTTFWIKQQKGC